MVLEPVGDTVVSLFGAPDCAFITCIQSTIDASLSSHTLLCHFTIMHALNLNFYSKLCRMNA